MLSTLTTLVASSKLDVAHKSIQSMGRVIMHLICTYMFSAV